MPTLAPAPPPVRRPLLAGRRVLVADDDAVCLALMVAVLGDAGARVREAGNGREAVLQAVAETPDLLVTDLDMPGLGGLAAAGILRWDFGLVSLPIIAVSTGPPPAAELLACGVNVYLAKPAAASDLLAAAENCLVAGVPPDPAGGARGAPPTVFDARGALARMGARPELLSRIVEVFLADHRTTAADIAAALSAGEIECAHRLCHALSGTGATVGAINLQRIAAELEQALRRGVRPDAADVTRLRRVLAETRAVMSAWLTAP